MLCLLSDCHLFNGVMALRKMDLFTIEALSDGKESTLIKVQDVLRYAGHNWWSDGAAEIMQIAWNIKNRCDGKLPPEPEAWLQFRGVSRKILMLILQDGFCMHPDTGVVCDRHVTNVMLRLGFTSVLPSDKKREIKIAEQIEQHLPKDKFRKLNEACACPRQLCANANNHSWMESVAKQVGCYDTFMKVIKGVKVGMQSSRNPTDQLDELVLSAAKKDYHLQVGIVGVEEAGVAITAAIAAVDAAKAAKATLVKEEEIVLEEIALVKEEDVVLAPEAVFSSII